MLADARCRALTSITQLLVRAPGRFTPGSIVVAPSVVWLSPPPPLIRDVAASPAALVVNWLAVPRSALAPGAGSAM
jgi:hypothetical protein